MFVSSVRVFHCYNDTHRNQLKALLRVMKCIAGAVPLLCVHTTPMDREFKSVEKGEWKTMNGLGREPNHSMSKKFRTILFAFWVGSELEPPCATWHWANDLKQILLNESVRAWERWSRLLTFGANTVDFSTLSWTDLFSRQQKTISCSVCEPDIRLKKNEKAHTGHERIDDKCQNFQSSPLFGGIDWVQVKHSVYCASRKKAVRKVPSAVKRDVAGTPLSTYRTCECVCVRICELHVLHVVPHCSGGATTYSVSWKPFRVLPSNNDAVSCRTQHVCRVRVGTSSCV